MRQPTVHRRTVKRRRGAEANRFSEAGDTLVEVLIAVVVLGLASTALMLGFATSISSSANHKNLATLDASVRTATNEAISLVQQQANATNGAFSCPDTFEPTSTTPGDPFNTSSPIHVQTYTPAYWNGTGFSNTCSPTGQPDYNPQQITMTLTSTNGSAPPATVSTVIFDPAPPPSTTPGAASKLVWLQSPSTGTINTPVSPQPIVAVEDNAGNIVYSDLSSVTLSVKSGPGSLSSTCSGVESYGVVPFGNCSLNATGTYTLLATDSNVNVASATSASFSIGAASAAQLVFTSATTSATASNKATLGPVTVQEQDAFGNPTTAGVTFTVSSSSSGGIFATSSSGSATSTLTLTIPSGSSTASFYYGDTVAGTPVLTAAASGLAPGHVFETINPGAPTNLAFTSTPFTAGTGNSAKQAFTVALQDAFGNITSTTTPTTVNLTSSSATGIFAALSGGTSVTKVTLPANNTTVTAYYGDPTAGTVTLTAAASGLTSGKQTDTMTLAPTKLVFTSNSVAGSASSSPTLGPITIQEENGSTPTTVGLTINLSSNSAGGVFSLTSGGAPVTQVTIPGGSSSATVYYGDTKAGSPTITAASGSLTSASQTETINAGSLSTFTLSTPSPTAGTSFSETITATDTFGNTVASYGGTQTLAFSGPANSPNNTAPNYPASVNFANGVGTATITLYDAQTTTLTAAAGLVSGTSNSFTVNAGGQGAFALSNPGTQTAANPFNETVTAIDNWGNTVTNFTGRQCITFSGPSNAPDGTPPLYPGLGSTRCSTGQSRLTFANGSVTVSITLYDAQNTSLIATQGTFNGNSGTFTVQGGNPANFNVSNPGTQTAGVAFSVAISSTDADGNVSTSFSGAQSITFSGPANAPDGTAPSYPSTVSFTNGVGTASVTLYDAQNTTLTVAQGGATGTSSGFTVISAALNDLGLPTPSPTAGAAFNETITAQDQYDNVVTTYSGPKAMTFSGPSNAPNGTPPSYPASVTFTNGVGTASITLFDAQTTTLTANQGTITGTSASFTVACGPAKSFSVITPATETAGSSFGLSMGATDAWGNAYTGTQAVNFSGPANAPNGTAPSYPANVTFTNGSGTANLTLFDAQTTAVTAGATGISGATTGNFVVNPGTTSTFHVSTPATQTAGTAFNETVTANDNWGNATPAFAGSQAVTFSGPASSPSGNGPSYPASLNFTNGVGTGSITLFDAQNTALTATQGAITGSSNTFTVNPSTPNSFSLSTPSPTAGTAFTQTITAVDQYGNTATSYAGPKTVSFSGPANAPNGTAPSYPASVTFTNGVGTASITLFDAQTTTLTATQGTGLSGSSASFTVKGASAKSFNLSTPSPTAGTAFTETITAIDQYQNTATSYTGNQAITFSGPSNSPNATAPAYPGSVAFSNGVGAANITLFDTQSTTLTATQAAVSGSSGTFTVNPGATSKYTLSAPGPQVAGVAFNETISATDNWGNNEPGYSGTQTVVFSGPANSPNNTAPTYPSSVTFNNGSVTTSITLYDAQTTALTATQGTLTGSSGNFTVNAAGASSFSLPNPGPQTAGTAFNETITAKDQYGNTATSYSGTKTVSFTGPSPAPGGGAPAYPGTVSFTNGAGTASITLVDAQSTNLTATQGSVSGSTGTFTVNAGGTSKFVLSNPPTEIAGTQFPVTITATDANGNTTAGYTGTKTVSFSGPTNAPNGTPPGYPASVTFTGGSGTANVTLFDASGTTLTATQGVLTGSTASFTVNAGPTTKFSVPTPSTQTAGTSFNETLTATDTWGNAQAAYTGSQAVAFSGPSNSPNLTAPSYPASVSFTNGTGTASITLFDAQSTTLTASQGAITGTSGAFAVNLGSVLTLGMPTPATQTAGTAFAENNITAKDAWGNGLSGPLTVTFSGPSNSPNNTSPTYPASVTFTNGVGSASITLVDAQSTTLTISASGDNAGSTSSFAVNPAAANQLVFTQQPAGSVTEGTAFTTQPKITVEDSFGNTVTTYATGVTMHVDTYTAGNGGTNKGSLGGCTSAVTPASGVATFANCDITGAAAAGTYTLDATSGTMTSAASNNLTIVAGPATTLTATSGAGQSANVSTAFTNPLVATATDANGNGVAGVAVTFAGPASGASETFSATGCTSNPHPYSCTVTTAANGQATSSTFTANATAGTYPITATASSLSANFSETNVVIPPIVYEGAGAAATATGSGNLTVNYPVAAASGDLLVMIVTHANNNLLPNTATPIGWTYGTTVSTTNGAGASLQYLYTVDGGGTSVTVNIPTGLGSSAGWTFEIVDFRNVNATPFDVASATSLGTAGSGTFTPTGLTTATAGDMALSIVMQNDNGNNTIPSLSLSTTQGFTFEFTHGVATATSSANGFALQTIGTPGAVTFPTWATNHTSAGQSMFLGISAALKP